MYRIYGVTSASALFYIKLKVQIFFRVEDTKRGQQGDTINKGCEDVLLFFLGGGEGAGGGCEQGGYGPSIWKEDCFICFLYKSNLPKLPFALYIYLGKDNKWKDESCLSIPARMLTFGGKQRDQQRELSTLFSWCCKANKQLFSCIFKMFKNSK